jgi:hypothetical protein
MGHIKHNAIVVTTSCQTQAFTARQKAINLGLGSTDVVAAKANGYYTFLIVPDGFKEGWDGSADGDRARAEWVDWADEYGIHSFVHVRYGGDDDEERIVDKPKAKGSWGEVVRRIINKA